MGRGRGREDRLRLVSHTCISQLDVRKEKVEFSALGGGTERGSTTQGEGGGGRRRRLNKKVSDIPNLWCRGDRSDSKVALFVSAEHKLP